MVDSHCHLAGEEFVSDVDAVLARARTAGVDRLLVIVAAEDDAEWARAAALADRDGRIDLAVGVHPHHAHLFAADPDEAGRLVQQRVAASSAVRAVGEIGLDYHYDHSPREVQQAVFRAQLALASALDMPVAIHTRDAEPDTLALIAEAQAAGSVRGIFHCFTGDVAAAERAVATGFLVSFAGILTFPRAVELRNALRATPSDRLLFETDAPYLAPVPHRGTRNEPALMAATIEAAARELGLPPPDVAACADRNYARLIGPGRPQTVVPQALSDGASR